jgi:hypothetical protein
MNNLDLRITCGTCDFGWIRGILPLFWTPATCDTINAPHTWTDLNDVLICRSGEAIQQAQTSGKKIIRIMLEWGGEWALTKDHFSCDYAQSEI